MCMCGGCGGRVVERLMSVARQLLGLNDVHEFPEHKQMMYVCLCVCVCVEGWWGGGQSLGSGGVNREG